MLDWIEKCIKLAQSFNLPVEFVTEDGTRTDPKTLKQLYGTAIDLGAQRVWIADTVGTSTPPAAYKIAKYFKNSIIGSRQVGLDWHGHDDRGLGVANSLSAVQAGADRIQATALAVGERAGNTSMEAIIINLVLSKTCSYHLDKLNAYSQSAATMFDLDIPRGYPGTGKYVFSTAAGMHAAAINKARKMNRPDLEEIVYCPFHPSTFAREIDILIGPMSGKANVEWVLSKLNLTATDMQIDHLLTLAKDNNQYLSHEQIRAALVQDN
jgi:2-isopropylmalate synthase